MSIKSNLTGSGLAPLAAIGIAGTVADNITAAGTTQATAQAVVADSNIVTTVAASAGVILRSDLSGGDEQEVVNLGANALSVYPPVGGAIQTGAANAAFSVGVGKTAKFRCRGALNFTAILSA